MQNVTDMKPASEPAVTAGEVGIEAYFAIERFLFVEAGVLDRRDYRSQYIDVVGFLRIQRDAARKAA